MAKNRFTTPVMTFVQGDLDEPQTKDAEGNLRVVKTGPNAGQPNPQYFMGGAIPKNSPEWPGFWAMLVNQAFTDFPHLFPQGAAPVIAAGGPAVPQVGVKSLVTAGLLNNPNFSFKVADGDGFDENGKSNAGKAGFTGCWIVRLGSAYPPRLFHAGKYAPQDQIQEKGVFKRGYFVRVNGTTEGNGNAQRPGLYLNLDMVELSAVCHPDNLIISGPSAEDAFGAPPAALPQGAMAPPAGNAPAAATPSPAAASPAAASPPTPAAPPYEGFMETPPAAPAPAPPAAPTPPPTPTVALTEKAGGHSYESLLAAGWTDDTLRQRGYLA